MPMRIQAIQRLYEQLAVIQEAAGEETTVAQAIVLLAVALHPEEKMTHLAEMLPGEPTHTLVSRTADRLGNHKGGRKSEPTGLLERRDVLDDRRAQTLALTRKGERLMERLS